MSIYDFSVTTIDGQALSLENYRGQVLLIVNVASRCGFTPQYAGLQAIYQRYRDMGFSILGFPCDQFAHQEPGSDADIKKFCSLTYDVTFPLFSKIEVNGNGTHPLFAYLKHACPGLLGSTSIKWNFTKFLVDRDGLVVRRYAPTNTPETIEKEVRQLIDR